MASGRSDGGGGGERVLWAIIRGLLTPSVHSRENPSITCSVVEKYHAEIVIYSGELHRTKEEILTNVEVLLLLCLDTYFGCYFQMVCGRHRKSSASY